MYEQRDAAWKAYRKALNEEPLENYQDLRDAFNAGFQAGVDMVSPAGVKYFEVKGE